MSVNNVDQDVLDTLTEDEIEAINGSTYSKEELEAMGDIAKEPNDGEDDDEDGDDAAGGEGDDDNGEADNAADGKKAEGEDAAAAAAAEAAKPEDKPAAAEVQEPPAAQRRAPVTYKAELPADYSDRVAKNGADRTELSRKFKEGEIDIDAYEVEQQKLQDARDELRDMKVKADISKEMTTQTAADLAESEEEVFKSTVKNWVTETAKAGVIDYAKDDSKRDDLQVYINAMVANPKNQDKSYTWFLNEAHKKVMLEHGLTAKPAAKEDDKGDAKPAAEAKPAERPRRQPKAPEHISQIQGGGDGSDVTGEFANLDGLDGFEFEDALAKMSPAQRERYASGR